MRLSQHALALSIIAVAATAQENPAELAAGAGCGGCHLAEQPMMGPSWQAIADRYRDQEGVESTLLEHIRSGSQGVWGEAPMPPVTPEQLTDDQLSAVLDWVLNR